MPVGFEKRPNNLGLRLVDHLFPVAEDERRRHRRPNPSLSCLLFLDALNAIRGKKLACEYQVPSPPPGETLNYGELNVEHTPPGQTQPVTVLYVGDAGNCNPTAGGWYYDADPKTGGIPTKIIMCPATCGAFAAGGQVDIRVGCKTQIAPPK